MATVSSRYALDIRFVDLAIFMSLGVWPWLMLVTAFVALWAWKFVLLCQLIALPFAVFGWALGFRSARRSGLAHSKSAMLAGWAGLLTAEVGLGLVLWPWLGRGFYMPGLWAFPALAVLVTVGVPIFYRAGTWKDDGAPLPESPA
jgi:hypothetical protein